MSEELELIAAVQEGNAARVRELLNAGADLHQQDDQGWTPLNWAAGRGDVGLVRLLLDEGADITKTGRDLRTPLMIAKAAGRDEVAAILTEAEKEKGVWQDPRETRPYCKAYYLRALRRFEGWGEEHAATATEESGSGDAGEAAGRLTSDSIVYVHQDFTVTRSMWHGEAVVFDDVTPEWKGFCEEVLEFAVPEDLL